MFDANINEDSCALGLTATERTSVKRAEASLPSGWHVTLETIDNQEIYARVIPPWNANLSAFLIDREGHGVILTDNISDDTHPVISVLCDVHDAIDRVVSVVSAQNLPERASVGNRPFLLA